MAAFIELAATNTVGPNDEMVVNIGHAPLGDRRMLISNFFAGYSAAPLFTNGIALGAAGVTIARPGAGVVRVTLDEYSIPAETLIALVEGRNGSGVVLVQLVSTGQWAIFAVQKGAGQIVFGDTAIFSGTYNANDRIVVFGDSSNIYLQNTFSSAAVIRLFEIV